MEHREFVCEMVGCSKIEALKIFEEHITRFFEWSSVHLTYEFWPRRATCK